LKKKLESGTMLKHLMNGSSLISLVLRDADNEGGSSAAELRNKQRAELMKNNTVTVSDEKKEAVEADEEDNQEGDEEGEEEGEEEDETGDEGEAEVKEGEEETEEQKKEREAKEKIAAKAARKQDRMQRRIDTAIADKKAAETEIAKLRAQLEANPDQKLTAEEVEAKAEALAAKKLADKQMVELQEQFDKTCEKLHKDALKVDKEFTDKINDIAEQFGAIPSFMIGVLEDFDNGGEVLAFIANDDDLAEEIYSFKNKPAKMTKKLVEISNTLADAKKPKVKKLSAVPDSVKPVKGNRVVSNTITEADAKNMESYVAKRQRQMLEKRKLNGF
jgi:hypothetical protein